MGYEKLSQKLTFYKAFFYPQWKFLINTILQCRSSKTTAWNEFSSTMASELDDSLVRAATTTSSLEAEQDSGNIIHTRSKATPNEAGSQGTTSGGNTLRSGEDSLKLQESMALCITLQSRVLNLETTMTTQANEIASLKRRVKKLEHKKRLRTHRLKRLYKVGSSRRVESSDKEGLGEENASKQGRIADINANKDIYLVNVHTDEDMFGVNDLDSDEVIVDNVDMVEITLAQALVELKSAKPKAYKDKGKGIMIEEPVVEQIKPIKRLEQIRLYEEPAFKLQVEEEEEERLAREKAQQMKEANTAWDDIQAKIE
ncbi:hypothetical protein Tco_0322512, partial [Tanacetum coccineum]